MKTAPKKTENRFPPTQVPETRQTAKRARKSAAFRSAIVQPSPSKKGYSERRRQKTVKDAIAKLKAVKLTPTQRRNFANRIERAPYPNKEAKRLIKWANRQTVRSDESQDIDLSDVQELKVKLIRRDGDIWYPQSKMLFDLECDVVEGIAPDEFAERAGRIWGMPQSLPKAFLERERC